MTVDSFITVENPGDETMGAAQTCDIIVSTMETSAADIMKYLTAKAKGLDGIEELERRYEEAKRAAVAGRSVFDLSLTPFPHWSPLRGYQDFRNVPIAPEGPWRRLHLPPTHPWDRWSGW